MQKLVDGLMAGDDLAIGQLQAVVPTEAIGGRAICLLVSSVTASFSAFMPSIPNNIAGADQGMHRAC